MKKIIASMAFVLLAVSGSIAQQSQPTAIIKNDKSTLVSEGNDKCTFTFELVATEDAAKDIRAHADLFADKYSYTMKLQKNGNYLFVMKIKIGGGSPVAQRCLAGLGITEFTFDGQKYSVHQLVNVMEQIK